MIECEKDALHAINLNRLLSKNWVELPQSYKILSKLKGRDNKRVDDILRNNRYS